MERGASERPRAPWRLARLVALSGWARVEVGDHTLAQVLAGAVVGAMVAGVAFPLLR
jgi:hypothetical protein